MVKIEKNKIYLVTGGSGFCGACFCYSTYNALAASWVEGDDTIGYTATLEIFQVQETESFIVAILLFTSLTSNDNDFNC